MRRSLVALAPHLLRPRRQPLVADFEITAEEAKSKFLKWQQQYWLAPHNVLALEHEIQPYLLPIWLFHLTAEIKRSANVGTKSKAESSTMSWKHVEMNLNRSHEFLPTLPSMQVYAGYRFRRDYVRTVATDDAMLQFRPLSTSEITSGALSSALLGEVRLPLPGIRESIAWEFVMRNVRDYETKAAEQELKSKHNADIVKDIKVDIKSLRRHVQLAYIPVYSLNYTYGETFNVHGERKPEHFIALVSGLKAGGVAGDRHFSAHKAGLIGSAAALGVSMLGSVASNAPVATVLSADTAFSVLITGSIAALSTRIFPIIYHQISEDRRIAEEHNDFEKVVSFGMSPLEPGSDQQETIRSDAEWKRWEQSDKQAWQGPKRRQWAEALWRSQHQRRIEREQLRKRLIQEQAQREQEEEREHRRRKRWGHASHHHGYRGDAYGMPQRNRDPRGYYKVLGLEVSADTEITQGAIKKAFRQLALRWHPDRHRGNERHARETFDLIKSAYDVLNDPEQKRLYDRGELSKHHPT